MTEIKKQARRGPRRWPSRPPSWGSRGSRWRQAAQKVAEARAKVVSVSVERSPPHRQPSIASALTRTASPTTPNATFVRQSPRDDAGRLAADNRFGRIRALISELFSKGVLRHDRKFDGLGRLARSTVESHIRADTAGSGHAELHVGWRRRSLSGKRNPN